MNLPRAGKAPRQFHGSHPDVRVLGSGCASTHRPPEGTLRTRLLAAGSRLLASWAQMPTRDPEAGTQSGFLHGTSITVAYSPIGKRTTTSIDRLMADSSKHRATSQTGWSMWLCLSGDDRSSADSSTNVTEQHELLAYAWAPSTTGSGTGQGLRQSSVVVFAQ